jgi:signal transduction histidine kinase
VQERTAELERTHARLLALERKASVAAERERLMRDMHDGIGSQLITMMEAVERGSADGAQVTRLLRECMDDLRLMIDSLEPEEYSLLVALGNLRYRLEPRLRAAGVALEWAVEEGVRAPSPDATLHLLRIVQEAVTNALKHARATRLRIACRCEADALVLEVADNGCGFSATEVRPTPATARRGLGNMLVRAHQLGGSLQRRDDGGGTRWVLRVPLGPAAT